MSDHRRDSGHDWCPPPPRDRAKQPNPPGDGSSCDDLPTCTPPTLDPPEPCPAPDPCCKCPPPPCAAPRCLDDLIAKQASASAAATDSNTFKTELEALQASASKGKADYTRDAYDKLIKKWTDLDTDIADFVRKLTCAVPCWRCIIDCYVCPMINELHYAETWLYGDGTIYADVHNLYDLKYWHTRHKDAKSRRLERIKTVLEAWKTPAKTIDDALSANKELLDKAIKSIGTEPGKVIYDVFMTIIPVHLALAPPDGSPWRTNIGKEYTEFCPCDEGEPDDCCGPDVGEWSLRKRLTRPLPYLVDPHDYFKVICCLVEKRYVPARQAVAKADADLADVTSRIERYLKQIKDGLASFETDARGAIPSVVECCDYERKDSDCNPKQAR